MTPEGARAGSQTAANAVLCGCCLEICVRAPWAWHLSSLKPLQRAFFFFFLNKVQACMERNWNLLSLDCGVRGRIPPAMPQACGGC